MTLNEPAFFDLPTPTGPMRVHHFVPAGGNRCPAVILYSEIFQVTGPIRRLAAKLAGEGFEVFAPEVYHEYEVPGAVLAYDQAGAERGNFLKFEKPVPAFDADARELIEWIVSRERGYPWQGVGTLGFCLGGHLAFRAALYPRVAATACFYPTNLHTADLGKGQQDDTLARSGEIEAELLLIWGRQDPHVPLEGRRKIYETLTEKERHFQWHEFNAAHAFSRDEGPRYDAAVSRLGWELTLELFKRKLSVPAYA
ncbi:carboxymethylenebutenolidase [Verrucomicrobium sp. GAS474]|uniref:dienelactone hydrolase family protein n=1 Tax=Verrucomicrobium sp. GAS474 TaxID=1882831 RepID=UPI00087C64D2|nr:dienelactone hydrolase family protein [Verrucomicrobium sp. GAS474]SDT91703.1 carboxymethylenebutenolidase [Verrucomicrobium sp. GAS474]